MTEELQEKKEDFRISPRNYFELDVNDSTSQPQKGRTSQTVQAERIGEKAPGCNEPETSDAQ